MGRSKVAEVIIVAATLFLRMKLNGFQVLTTVYFNEAEITLPPFYMTLIMAKQSTCTHLLGVQMLQVCHCQCLTWLTGANSSALSSNIPGDAPACVTSAT